MGEISIRRLFPYLILGMILGFSLLTAATINAVRYGSIYRVKSNSIHNIWLSQPLNLTFGDKCYNTEILDGRFYSCLLNPSNGSTNLTLLEIQFYPNFTAIPNITFHSCSLPVNGSYYGLSKTGGLYWTLEGHVEKFNNSDGIRLSQNLVGFLPNGQIVYNYSLSVPDFSSYSQLYFPRIWFTIISDQFWVIEMPYPSIIMTKSQPVYRNLSIYSLYSFQLKNSFILPYNPLQFNLDDRGLLWLLYSGNPLGRSFYASIYGYYPLLSDFSSIESTIQILNPIPSGDLMNRDTVFIENGEDIRIHRIFTSADRLLCSLGYQNESTSSENFVGFRIVSLKSSLIIPLGYGFGSLCIVIVVIVVVIQQFQQKKLLR